MNESKFVSKYNKYQKAIPALDHKTAMKIRELIEGMQKDAEPDHVMTIKSVYMSDKAHCSCGWESPGFWDGVEYASKHWRDHVYNEITSDIDTVV
jgi:hypothetical protein